METQMVKTIEITKFLDEAGNLHDTEEQAEKANEQIRIKNNPYLRYIHQTYDGQKLIEKYSLNEYGIWTVYGEDSNCDMGGHHYEPKLGVFEGTLEQVIRHATQMKGFWTWGYGGRIEKTKIQKIIKL